MKETSPHHFLISLFTILNLISHVTSQSESTSHLVGLDKPFSSNVFHKLDHFPCVTLYHREGHIGCGTFDRDDTTPARIVYWKNVGPFSSSSSSNNNNNNNNVNMQADTKDDDDKQLNYVAVMTDLDYTTSNVATLVSLNQGSSSFNLLGVLVVNHTVIDTDTSTAYTSRANLNDYTFSSPESMYPQGFNTPSASLSQFVNNEYAWNPSGDAMIEQDYYGIPTVYIPNKEVSIYLYQQSKDQMLSTSGSGGANIVAQFNYYMGPDDATSAECLSWRDTDGEWSPKCLPLGGNSIWGATGTPPPSSEDANENNENQNQNQQQFNARDVILLATSIDSTAAFHDAATGASTAASNIMTLLLSAYHLGKNLSWNDLDNLSKQLVFGFFEGESYGYMGSRNFFKDKEFPGLSCDYPNGEGCMYPMRPTLNFQNLGNVVGMIAVDQVGVLETEKSLYVHADNNGQDLENVLLQFNAANDDANGNEYNVMSSNVDDAVPPSPLVSLIELSEGTVGGVVLTGYDEAFLNGVYQSHFDSAQVIDIDLDAIQNAALLLARSGVAAAYLGDDDEDYENAATASKNMIPDLDSDDEEYTKLVDNLYNCLFIDGMCSFWQKYTETERKNAKDRTGIDLGAHDYRVTSTMGAYGKATPNYYVSIYDLNHGQPVVQVNGNFYAAYNQTVDESTKKDGDGKYLMKASALEAGIYGLLNEFLGQNGVTSNDGDDSSSTNLAKCSSSGDCQKVSYCPDEVSSICTGGGKCVCGPSSFYHIAIDESIEAVPNTTSGQFQVVENDEGLTPMYTEPYWSMSVGVTLFEESGEDIGNWVLLGGSLMGIACAALSFILRRKMVKEKLF